MANLYFWQINSNTSTSYTSVFKLNGSTVFTGSNPNGGTASFALDRTFNPSDEMCSIYTGIDFAIANFDWIVRENFMAPHGAFLFSDIDVPVLASGVEQCTLLGSRARYTGPPTYLETLDKLDQYSKAQYIPR